MVEPMDAWIQMNLEFADLKFMLVPKCKSEWIICNNKCGRDAEKVGKPKEDN